MGCSQSTTKDEEGKKPQKKFKDVYKTGDTLGEGAFAQVCRGLKKGTEDTYAIKVVNRGKLSPEDDMLILREMEILASLKHPNIVRLYETFTEQRFYYLVLEEMYGGELFDRIVQKQSYNEKEARDCCLSLLDALSYLEANHVVHRDLKPENILLWTPGDDSCIKLADFGFAKRNTNGEDCLTTQCGTPTYVAPEMLKGKSYGHKADMWSMGVITYILLGGYPPFLEQDQKTLFRKISKGEFEFHKEYWNSVSKEAKKLISSMLTVNPSNRVTASDALKDSQWITQVSDDVLTSKNLGKNLQEFKKFNAKRKFKAAVKGVIAANMMKGLLDGSSKTNHFDQPPEEPKKKRKLSKEEKEDLKETFEYFDKDGGGTIDVDELKLVLNKLGMMVNDHELKKIMRKIDNNNDGVIDYKEFLEMMKQMPDYETELKKAFAFFDVDGSGTTTKKELRAVLRKFGQKLTKEELGAVVAEVDADGNGEIDFEEFKQIMSKA